MCAVFLNESGFDVRWAVGEGPVCTPVASGRIFRFGYRFGMSSGNGQPKLLSGGNPQISKGDGDAPVQAYIAALPEWKHDVGKRLDQLIVAANPGVVKAVRWNSPFYGIEGAGWHITYHALTKYMKVTFLQGAHLDPVPPESSKDPDARYLHVFEDGEIDEAQFTSWVQQATALEGWDGF